MLLGVVPKRDNMPPSISSPLDFDADDGAGVVGGVAKRAARAAQDVLSLLMPVGLMLTAEAGTSLFAFTINLEGTTIAVNTNYPIFLEE